MSQEMDERSQMLKEMGESIRARRESLGLTLESVRDKTLIRTKYLLAIEEGDDSQVPGNAYFKGFLKSYANALGLDGFLFSKTYQELIDREQNPPEPARRRRGAGPQSLTSVAAQRPPAARREASTPQVDTGERRERARRPRRTRPALALFVMLFLVTLGVYYMVSHWGLFSQEAIVPPEDQGPKTPDAAPPAGEPPPPPKVSRTDPNREKTVWETEAESLTLVVKVADQEGSSCWVRVSQDGKVILEDTLKRAEKREFSGAGEIIIRAGKPWVLNLNLGGVDLGVGGEYGPVKDLVFRVAKAP